MTVIELIFWLALFIVFYAYVGYGIFLYIIIRLRRLFGKNPALPAMPEDPHLPEVTLMVAAYNEEDFIDEKIRNSLNLDYPSNKLKFIFVTDGSTDSTTERIRAYNEITLLHEDSRRGKIAAVERAMAYVETPLVIYTDANTMLNPQAAKNIVRHYENPKVGAVAGEKRVTSGNSDSASGAGEGFYWKYESALKRWDSELYSVVGAAGELFSIRTELYEEVPKDTVIEDFFMTLRIAKKGYKVVYEPEAYAVEGPSANVKEELKRKVRIAAGGIQAIVRLAPLLNLFKYGTLSWQYVSHRVLRWTIAPLCLAILMAANIVLAVSPGGIYKILLVLQFGFYIAALIGYLLEQRQLKFKAFFIPYYFFIMNYAVYAGFWRYMKGSQSVVWERAKRK
ncbi:glycosyltransferase family 2 protein [Roseivirga sp. BDSF3-8]|uniref:glycosyltransferase family 2 protein n=1 Tax=Roseivirga sp. BDSF3-8 TaxID=3241598 RepID=UPI003531A27B